MKKSKHGKKALKIVVIAAAVFFAFYIILANFLVSACLVPSFMKKLDDFERITKESYAQQVQGDALKANHKKLLEDTGIWYENVIKEKISVTTGDGYQLIATEFRCGRETHKWALVLHGYTGWKEEMYPFAKYYVENGYNAIVPDLRCQGESEGDFIGMGLTDSLDCRLWLGVILSEDPDAEIILHGQSMGAATALIMTGTGMDELGNIKAVVSDSAYTDAYSMFGNKITEWFHLPAFPLVDTSCLMLKLRGGYDLKKASALNAVQKSSTPVLIIHGEKDAMISVNMAYGLYDAAVCEKEIYIVPDAGHGQTQDKEPEQYFGRIGDFLGKYCGS